MFQDPEVSVSPARRRVLAESWWIASELASRHPDHIVYEIHPGGGMYDCLTLAQPGRDGPGVIMLNREGTIHVHAPIDGGTDFGLTWANALSADSPHDVVKQLEIAARIQLARKRPPTTQRTLVYRVIAAFLALQLNDRHQWDARSEFLDTSGYGGGARGYLAGFPDARNAADGAKLIGIPGEPESHFWAVLRNGEPIAVMSINGMLYTGESTIELLPLYRRLGSVAAVVTQALGRWLS
ncbi:MAG: hypothetical protein ACRDT9_02440 [Agromyces sp.]